MTALLPLYRQRVRFTIAQTHQRGDLAPEIVGNRANVGYTQSFQNAIGMPYQVIWRKTGKAVAKFGLRRAQTIYWLDVLRALGPFTRAGLKKMAKLAGFVAIMERVWTFFRQYFGP